MNPIPHLVEANVIVHRWEDDLERRYDLRVRAIVTKGEQWETAEMDVLQGGLHILNLTEDETVACEAALHEAYEVTVEGALSCRERTAFSLRIGNHARMWALIDRHGWPTVAALARTQDEIEFARWLAALEDGRRAA